MKRTLSVFFYTVCLSTACTYEPEETYYKEIDASPPDVQVSLNQYNEADTIVLYTAADFHFNIDVTRGQIAGSKVSLGSTVLFDDTEASGSFSIRDQNLKTGIYELKIEFVTSSGTGSFLDQMGYESYQIWRTWVVLIDVDPPPAPDVQLSIENGFLKVSWMPFTKPNFVKYEIHAPGVGSPKTITITDQNRTSWIDTSYAGGYASYQVSVSTVLHTTEGAWQPVNEPQEFDLSYSHADTVVTMTWRKCRYYGAFGQFIIKENGKTREIINDPSDTTLVLKLQDVIMGGQSWVDFEMQRKADDLVIYNKRIDIENPLQLKRIEEYVTLFYNQSHALMGLSASGLCSYNDEFVRGNCHSAIVSIAAFPYHGSVVYYISDRYVVQYNLDTHEQKQMLMTNSGTYSLFGISGGGNGIVHYAYIDNTHAWDRRFHQIIANVNTNAILLHTNTEYDPKTGYYYNYFISDHGTFAYYPKGSGSIYKITGDTLQFHLNPGQTLGRFHSFRPDMADQAFFTTATSVNLVDLENASILKTFDFPATGYSFLNYDSGTQNLLLGKAGGNKLFVVHADMGTVLTVSALGDRYRLINGYILDQSQFYYKLPL